MVKRNPNIAKLKAGYLFPEINRRKKEFMGKNPGAKIISLGIGNTTEPLTQHIVDSLRDASISMGTKDGYSGYGDEVGLKELRERIAQVIYKGIVSGDEIFMSDGAKCDIGRLQVLFGKDATIAVQDPSYPVYVDGSVIIGATDRYDPEKKGFDKITYMECNSENDFFPDLENTQRTDLIYFCSPNNPTGKTTSKEELKKLIGFAKKNKSIIIYDAAYSEFIAEDYPKSIFEIDGARDVAIEVNSFSKPIGFTGVRLGWTVVPKELKFDDGTPVAKDWTRIMTTIFNGASNIVQKGGIAALDDKGLAEMKDTISYYMENARLIKDCLDTLNIKNYGSANSPYIWAYFPGRDSWDIFSDILEKCHIVTTPGSGFGPSGEGYIRFSAFGHRENIKEAVERLKEKF